MIESEVFITHREDMKKFDKLFCALALDELFPAGGRIAVKLHMGEDYSKYIVKPAFVARAVELLKSMGFAPFVTDTTALYRGGRDTKEKYLKTAARNGFTSDAMHGAKIVIADGDGDEEVVRPITTIKQGNVAVSSLKHVRIAKEIANCSGMLVLTHVKGHRLVGFGGAIKNVGMGCVSKSGKREIHNINSFPTFNTEKCSGCGLCTRVCQSKDALRLDETTGKVVFNRTACVSCGFCYRICKSDAISFEDADPALQLQRCLADATRAVHGELAGRIAGINFVRDVTCYCDCVRPTRIISPNVGMLAAHDLVALDQASYDEVKKAAGHDAFLEATRISGEVQMSVAQVIGVGCRHYVLKEV